MKRLWCIHGNLQQHRVWTRLKMALQRQELRLQIQTIDLWATLLDDCWTWSENLCATVGSLSSKATENYLLGYSLGGRLGFHSLLHCPDLWAGAVIVSADPGTSDLQQREQCLSRDRTWAQRFLTEPWDDLLAEWDTLSVFCGRPCTTHRPETAFDRQKIAQAFVSYSKGRMDDLTHRLRTLPVPITYVTGSDDRRYGELGRTLSAQCPNLLHLEVTDAGHRVPWEQPEAFQHLLMEALAL